MNHSLARKSEFCMAASADHQRGWTEKFQWISQSQTCSKKKVTFTVFCQSIYSSSTSQKIIHLRNMFTNWWDPPQMAMSHPALVKRNGWVSCNNDGLYVTQSTLQKRNKFGYKIMPRPPHSPDLSDLLPLLYSFWLLFSPRFHN